MHKLLADKPGKQILMLGNEAIARGALEAGVAFAATYPGTPSSEISLYLFQISKERELYFEYSTNEKTALEVMAATANCGARSLAIMKHVGLNVAADTLMTLAYVGVKGGLVIVSADDPYMFSSQNEQDNRYYGKLSGLPILEPSSVEEAKTMMTYAFELSEQLQEPVLFRTTTRINHSTAGVSLGPLVKPVSGGTFNKDPFNYVTVPAVSRKLHAKLLKNYEQAVQFSEKSALNHITGEGSWGIIVSGVSYNYAVDAVKDLGIEAQTSLFRIGFSHPLPSDKIKTWLSICSKCLVIEEGEPFLEESIKALAQETGLNLSISGKGPDLFTRLNEYNPALVRQVIARYFGVAYTPPPSLDLSDLPEIPERPPNLCAGCSHRATFYALNKAVSDEGHAITCSTDIGCYTLGFLPPLSIGDFLICMGSSVGTACGFSKALNPDQKVVAVIGDSTFFHSGMTGLVNAVFNNHNFTLIILDNATTAMTGHQPHPGVDMQELNYEGYTRISIEAVVRAMGVPDIHLIRPYNVKKSTAVFKKALSFKGVSVIIAQERCALHAKALKKLHGRPFYISSKCQNHRTCLYELGCPAFYLDDQVKINPEMCTGCGVCAQICPENAILPIK